MKKINFIDATFGLFLFALLSFVFILIAYFSWDAYCNAKKRHNCVETFTPHSLGKEITCQSNQYIFFVDEKGIACKCSR